MERRPFVPSEHLYSGNTDVLFDIVKNPHSVVVIYDIDGILANSPQVVLNNFSQNTEIKIAPVEIDRWNMLTHLAETHNLSPEVIATAENDWYDPDVLIGSQRYLFARPMVRLTQGHFGKENNYVLTARNYKLREITFEWFREIIPSMLEENILIRDENCKMESRQFKVSELKRLAKKASWVIYIEDFARYAKAALAEGPKNCLVVNVPLGLMRPNFEHERLIVVGRYPNDMQGMYPTYRLFRDGIREATQDK